MYHVAIVGAGIGGSYLSYLLGKEGVDTIVFDFRAPHDKLCGGCVTYKTVERFPIIDELPCPRHQIRRAALISPKDRVVTVKLDKPLTMFSRKDLDYSLLKKAMKSGTNFRKEKVHNFNLEGNNWRISAEGNDYRAKILVGADGAMSGARRRLRLPPKKKDFFFAIQSFLDMEKDFAIFKFFSDLKGYLWVFPRVEKLVIGIGSKNINGFNSKSYSDIKKKLLDFIERYYPRQIKGISIKGAYIPFFSVKDFQDVPISSENWALIGDAASFVDPIGGEGIYYAMYSAEILARCILKNDLSFYQQLCMRHFGEYLVKASQAFECFYQSEFIENMVTSAEESTRMHQIISDMISGNIAVQNNLIF